MQRNVFIYESITEATANRVIRQLIRFDQMSHEPIRIFIKCDGGDIEEGKAICLTILSLKSPIITIVVQKAESMAASISQMGDCRLIMRRGRIDFHNATCSVDDIVDRKKKYSAQEMRKLAVKLIQNADELERDDKWDYQMCTAKAKLGSRQLRARVRAGKEESYLLKAREAKELGFVDGIISSFSSIDKYERKLKNHRKKKPKKKPRG